MSERMKIVKMVLDESCSVEERNRRKGFIGWYTRVL